MNEVKTGRVLGTGAAINVELGFIPDHVEVINVTDQDRIDYWCRGRVLAFTSGGTSEIEAGDTITGATSGATAVVREVHKTSGTWAGGDAAGYFVWNEEDQDGTFQSENVHLDGGSNDASVGGNAAEITTKSTTAVAAVSSNGISAYVGSSTAAPGFTIGSDTSESGKLLQWVAFRAAD